MLDQSHFHFIRPTWLIAIIPILILFYFLQKRQTHDNAWQTVCDAHLLPHLLMGELQTGAKKFLWSIFLIWCLSIFALAGPAWERLPQPLYKLSNATVIALDLSVSMEANDLQPNRITRARFKVLDILKRLRDGRTGMVAFASEAYTVSPLTEDTNTIAAMVPVLTPDIMPVEGNSLSSAMNHAAKLFKAANAKIGNIILMTDSNPTNADFRAAETLHKNGFDVSVLAVGSNTAAPIPTEDGDFEKDQLGNIVLTKPNMELLKKLATVGGGRFSEFTMNSADIDYLLQPILTPKAKNAVKDAKAQTALYRDEGYWFVLLLLPFILLLFRRGRLEDLIA